MSEQLAKQFTAEGVSFSMQDQVMLIEVENEFAQATLSTHGASILSYTPKGHEDVLWVSPDAVFDGQKAIRGGIPVCWPWFGKAAEAGLPAHGFVRNTVWQLDHVAKLDSGVTEVVLTTQSSEKTLPLWSHHFHLELRVEVGEKLAVSLTTYNKNNHDIEITEALHTYFNVSDVNKVSVNGVQGSTEHDTLQSPPAVSSREASIDMQAPMDSVFTNQTSALMIDDSIKGRQIKIEKAHADSTIVWNPGPEIVKGFADIADDDWSGFICVEAGNVFDNKVFIPAGEKHTMQLFLSVER